MKIDENEHSKIDLYVYDMWSSYQHTFVSIRSPIPSRFDGKFSRKVDLVQKLCTIQKMSLCRKVLRSFINFIVSFSTTFFFY